MTKNLLGIDIGGTKCAIIYGIDTDGDLNVSDRVQFPTTDVKSTLNNIMAELKKMCQKHSLDPSNTKAVGISCGGPLDSRRGVIMSPPNLPGWDNIPICKLVEEAVGIKAYVQNDANACALAEWKYGAGRGTRNMVFMTFGTGLGAGLVLDGKLYAGSNDNAGELGHIRLSDFGPVGYGKAGSFEGFCSGGGIAQLARIRAKEKMMMGQKVGYCPDGDLEKIDTKIVSAAMREQGDEDARAVFETSARYLGRGLSILIDIINPEVIVIGSVYARNEKYMKPIMEEVIRQEALGLAADVCKVVPAQIGEAIGDYAALSLAAAAD